MERDVNPQEKKTPLEKGLRNIAGLALAVK